MSCYKIHRERDVEYWFPDVRIAERVERTLYDIAASYIARFCYWGIQTFKEQNVSQVVSQQAPERRI